MKKGKVRALLLSALVMSCATAALPADAAAASRSCGVVKNPYGVKVEVLIERGSISCASARKLVKGLRMGPGAPSPRGWSCWRAVGVDAERGQVGGCSKRGVTVKIRLPKR